MYPDDQYMNSYVEEYNLPHIGAPGCTLTLGQKLKAALLCELLPKETANSHSAPARFEPPSILPTILYLPLRHAIIYLATTCFSSI